MHLHKGLYLFHILGLKDIVNTNVFDTILHGKKISGFHAKNTNFIIQD